MFYSDWTISHVINGFNHPTGIAFDLSSNLHVIDSRSVSVFTPSGKFIRQYGERHISGYPARITINPSGYSLVTNTSNTLLVFNTNGVLIHTVVEGFQYPHGVSVSPTDQSVWVADTFIHRLVKY